MSESPISSFSVATFRLKRAFWKMQLNDNTHIIIINEEKEYVCVWKIRTDKTDIPFQRQARSSLCLTINDSAVRQRGIVKHFHNPFEDEILRNVSHLATMPTRIKQTALFSSNKSLRGYARICMITLIAWLPKSKYFLLLSRHASAPSSQQI